MGGTEFVLAIIFLAAVVSPIAKGIAERIARSGGTASPDTKRLEAALQQTEQRLADSERRLGSMEERLEFYEKLLGESSRSRELPR